MSKKKKKQEDLAVETEVSTEELYEFDSWWALRETSIPKQHYKEIIMADFKGQGLGKRASIEAFDAALARYGVKL
jgi:hypothetical protein